MPAGVGLAFEADAAGQVALGVHVDEQDALLGEGEGGREVDGGSGFTDAALLIGDGEDAGHLVVRPNYVVFHVEQSAFSFQLQR